MPPKMLLITPLLATCLTIVSSSVAQEPLVPLSMDYGSDASLLVDHSHFLDAPAGRDGFIRMDGEHLVSPKGERFRIWGVNMAGPSCFPDRQGAVKVANDLARLGINCVRFHGLDSNWGRSAIDYSRDDTLHLNEQDLDRWDYLVAELKKRGIYTNINLNVFRHFKDGDGVRDAQLLGMGKSATYFNPRLVELQKDYARKLLTHRNAYTGNEYRHEPAVICVEMVNENSVLEGWLNWRLVGTDDENPQTWSPLPVSYAEELAQSYNIWLQETLSSQQLTELRNEAGVEPDAPVPCLKPNEFAQASETRFHTEATYYLELEKQFFQQMKDLLQDELGVKPLLIGTADHNDWICGYPHISANMIMDVIDGHGYWEHPDIGEVTSIKNTPMVNDPWDSTVIQFARTPVVGRPYTISETNHPFPHEYACEGFPILTAYALLQDWDGIYWFTYDRGPLSKPKEGIHRNGWFDFSVDPVKMTNVAACTPLWYRHDVRPATTRIIRSYTHHQIMEHLRGDRAQQKPFYAPGFPRSTPLVHATRFTLDAGASTPFPQEESPDRILADTGELGWFNAAQKHGLVTVDTPNSCALIGFVKENARETSHLAAEVENVFCMLLLSSLEDEPISEAQQLILAATAKSANAGTAWEEDRKTLKQWGTGPTVVEPVRGRIYLHGLEGVSSMRVTPLSPTGKRMNDGAKVTQLNEVWQIELGTPVATWYLIDVERQAE